LAKRDAVEQLIGLLQRLPGPSRPLAEEVRQIAVALIDVLPPAKGIAEPTGTRGTEPATTSRDRAFWVICCVLVAVAVLIMITN
jgi:choline-glycine betaine transporter